MKTTHRITYGWFQLLDKCLGRKRGARWSRRARTRYYNRLERHLEKNGPLAPQPIERISNISLKELKRNYINKSIPVIIEGGAIDWPCVQQWSIDYFDELHGNDEVTIVGNDATEKAFEILKLSEVLDDIRAGGNKYYRFYPLLQEHPEHIADFDYSWLRGAKNRFGFWEQFQVFIGGRNTYTPLHNAMASNLFVQVYGEKEWIIYPPNLTAIIDPEPGVNFHRGAPFKTSEGPFNPFRPEYTRPYRLYEHVEGIRVHLKPGDILFNPPHYWHAVTNPTDSIGVGYRWISPRASFRAASWYTLLDWIDAPFNKNMYLNRKKDYNLLHLMEMGKYADYLKEKQAK